jgi:hypothetical protein
MSDVELTKKAEAYVANVDANLAATSLLTLHIDRTSWKSLAGSIEALIDMLDDLSPDPDLEPWLGDGDDREDENEHAGDINDEPQADASDDEHSLGWTEDASQSGNLGCFGSEGDLELELGTTEHVDQDVAGSVQEGLWLSPDGEPELGFVGIGTGWRKGEDVTDLGEHVDEREPNGDEEDSSRADDEFTHGIGRGDGSGHEIARKMLREHARRLPSGDIVREIAGAFSKPEKLGSKTDPSPTIAPPLDPDVIDLRAHYWAAKGF